MININALIGCLIGIIILFIIVRLFIIIGNKVFDFECSNNIKTNLFSNVLTMEGFLNAYGCCFFSVIYVILHFLLNNQENIVKYIILSVVLNIVFQSLLSFIENKLYFEIKNNRIVLLSMLTTLILLMFFAFPNIYIKLVVMAIVLLVECVTIYYEFTGIWDSIFNFNLYTLEDIFFLYLPPLAVFISILITIL